MSADLFAEFNDSSTTPQPQPQPHPQPHPQQPQDAFGFSLRSNAAPAPQPAAQWPSFSSPPNNTSMSAWGQPSSISQVTPSPAVIPQQTEDDDGWGDFEVAQPSGAATSPKVETHPAVSGSIAWHSGSTLGPGPSKFNNSAAQPPVADLTGGALVDFGGFSSQGDQYPRSSWSNTDPNNRVQKKPTPSDSNVLFDADDFELQDGGEEGDDIDEFGDFEAFETTPHSKPTQATSSQLTSSLDLLGLDDPPVLQPQKETKSAEKEGVSSLAPSALSFGAMASNKSQSSESEAYHGSRRNPTESSPALTRKEKPSSISASSTKKLPGPKRDVLAKPTAHDDEWGAWDDFTGDDGSKHTSEAPSKIPVADEWGWGAGDNNAPTTARADDTSPPPMNIPPPSILLSAFPELFSTGNALFTPVASQGASIKQKILSNPKAVQFLEAYVLLATTAARVIAGRKHRWHRDKILAKSMSISAAGSKGMKLAGVDKQQSAREDREAADVVAAWREHVGRLRSAVAAANSTSKVNLKVPELTENPQIQTAKLVPTAPKPCIVCGLKREERVAKVDVDVEDSFGEWWVDHWGHRACKNFWLEHEQQLRQR